MNSQILIDAIVRHTTVLIARISTADGTRSPLRHIADEVFAGLVAELDNQRVSKKIIADMFGMALRSYRQKVQRMGESATTRGETLWSALQNHLAEREKATRREILEHFESDDETSVRGILNDLVESGFVVRSGRGEETTYRAATEEELRDVGAALEDQPVESLAALAWLQVYREGPTTLQDLEKLIPVSSTSLGEALEQLEGNGRVTRRDVNGQDIYTAEHVLIPIGEAAGWEAAVMDHHRTVLSALAAKLTSGTRSSARSDEVGGTTLTFDLWPGHPHEETVRRLLSTTRSTILPLWEEVTAFNDHNQGEGQYQVHFYCGQYLVGESSDE